MRRLSASTSAQLTALINNRRRGSFRLCGDAWRRKRQPSPLRQLQLERAVAAEGFIGKGRIERLKFAKPGRDKPLGRHPLRDEILHHGDCPRSRQVPVRTVLRRHDRPYVGMSVDTEHPRDFGRYLLFEIEEGDRELVEFAAALGVEDRRAGVEEQLGLEYEAVAHHPDIGACPENLAKLAKKVGAIARQFLHPLRQGYIEPLAEVGDLALGLLVALFRGVERLLERRQL